ncbi:MAG TPA: AzlC family ABC transporter permease [Peptococcaceae bacterium]|nr:AzlC family ABC transporter permease [Peptococcaceae bacterium]
MRVKGFIYGLRQSVTIGIGYAPVALTFGILSLKSGLNILETGLMSMLVFAGASQFITIQLIGQGATIWVIGITTLIVNLRHILMSFSMIRFFPGISLGKLSLLAQGITDETFVLNSKLLEEIPTPEERSNVALGVNIGAFVSWVFFSFLGAWFGNRLNINFSGFDFALLALFIVLTIGTVNRQNITTYIIAGLLAVIFKIIIPGKIYLLLSVALAAAIGAFLQQKQLKQNKCQGENS